MEDRRTAADQSDRHQNKRESGRGGEREQSAQRETHPHGQRIGSRMEVGQPPGNRLQERRGELKNQRDEADLREREAEFLFVYPILLMDCIISLSRWVAQTISRIG